MSTKQIRMKEPTNYLSEFQTIKSILFSAIALRDDPSLNDPLRDDSSRKRKRTPDKSGDIEKVMWVWVEWSVLIVRRCVCIIKLMYWRVWTIKNWTYYWTDISDSPNVNTNFEGTHIITNQIQFTYHHCHIRSPHTTLSNLELVTGVTHCHIHTHTHPTPAHLHAPLTHTTPLTSLHHTPHTHSVEGV